MLDSELTSLTFVEEEGQWITKNKKAKEKKVVTEDNVDNCIDINGEKLKTTISFQEGNHAFLCGKGNFGVDARMLFKTSKEPVLLVLQMKHTTNEKKGYLYADKLQQTVVAVELLQKEYPQFKVICGIITNKYCSDEELKKIREWDNFFLITQDQIPLFAPLFHSRLLSNILTPEDSMEEVLIIFVFLL